MKRRLAGTIQIAAAAAGTWLIGVYVRGPLADRSLCRDLFAGAAIVGSVAALEWSRRELDEREVTG